MPSALTTADHDADARVVDPLDVRHVLVPLDGSDFSARALPTAQALAARLQADVHAVTVTAPDDAQQIRGRAAAALGVSAEDARISVMIGTNPAEAIARRAADLGSSIVTMSTHGRGRLSGALIGSVARSLLRRSPDPIIAVGPRADEPGWIPRPRGWPQPLSIPRIVACVDGTSTSEQVLPVAARWATVLGMSLTILTVIEEEPAPLRPERRPSRYGPHPDAAAYIGSLVEEWGDRAPAVRGEVVRDPIGPASAIRTYLSQQPAGLVAVTTHARSGLDRAVLGATAAGIVNASTAPTLVVHARDDSSHRAEPSRVVALDVPTLGPPGDVDRPGGA